VKKKAIYNFTVKTIRGKLRMEINIRKEIKIKFEHNNVTLGK